MNRTLIVFADLPCLIAKDERSFGDLIDCLCFLFYEGAGKDKLRFLNTQQGVLDDNECQLIIN